MLKFDQVSKEFKDGNQMIEAVKSTSLTFDKGELIAIVGLLVPGKYILTMAGALQTPTHGEIYINDNKISQLSQKQLAKMRMKEIGFILQSTNLVPFLTIKQQFRLLKNYKKKF